MAWMEITSTIVTPALLYVGGTDVANPLSMQYWSDIARGIEASRYTCYRMVDDPSRYPLWSSDVFNAIRERFSIIVVDQVYFQRLLSKAIFSTLYELLAPGGVLLVPSRVDPIHLSGTSQEWDLLRKALGDSGYIKNGTIVPERELFVRFLPTSFTLKFNDEAIEQMTAAFALYLLLCVAPLPAWEKLTSYTFAPNLDYVYVYKMQSPDSVVLHPWAMAPQSRRRHMERILQNTAWRNVSLKSMWAVLWDEIVKNRGIAPEDYAKKHNLWRSNFGDPTHTAVSYERPGANDQYVIKNVRAWNKAGCLLDPLSLLLTASDLSHLVYGIVKNTPVTGENNVLANSIVTMYDALHYQTSMKTQQCMSLDTLLNSAATLLSEPTNVKCNDSYVNQWIYLCTMFPSLVDNAYPLRYASMMGKETWGSAIVAVVNDTVGTDMHDVDDYVLVGELRCNSKGASDHRTVLYFSVDGVWYSNETDGKVRKRVLPKLTKTHVLRMAFYAKRM